VHYDGTPNLNLNLHSNERAERVSDFGACSNTDPCLTIDGYGRNVDSIPNQAHFTWHASQIADTVSEERIRYRIRHKYWDFGPQMTFASGAMYYFAPSIFVCPHDTVGETMLLTWYTSKNTMVLYVPGDTILHTYPLPGKYPTLTFFPNMPSGSGYVVPPPLAAGTLFQTPTTPYLAVTIAHNAVVAPPAIQATRGVLVQTVFVNKYHGLRQWRPTCTWPPSLSVALKNTFPPSANAPVLTPISPTLILTGNGTAENGAVKSAMFVMHLGVPVEVQRTIVAQDTGALSDLTAGGRSATALVEILDSASNTVLAVVDSFTVSHATDTICRHGTLNFYPTMDIVGFPVYLRARIVADTSVTQWHVTTHAVWDTTADTVGTGGFAKQTRDYGKAGEFPVMLSEIDLKVSPNPFTHHIRFLYTVTDENANELVEVKIFDILGHDVAMLVSEVKPAGRYAIEFNGEELKTGTYIIAVHERNNMQSRMIVRVR
jgi:hypothetical protein